MATTTENLSQAVAQIFKVVLEDAAELCAEEAAKIAADRARKHVKEAFAKFAAKTTCDSSFELMNKELRLTVRMSEDLMQIGKAAMMDALLGRGTKP